MNLTWLSTTIICFSIRSNDKEDSHDRRRLSNGLNWNESWNKRNQRMFVRNFTICLWKRSSCCVRLRRNSKQRNWWYLSSDAYSGQLNDQTKKVSRIASLTKYKIIGPGWSWLATSSVSNVIACWKWDKTQLISSWSTNVFWNICKICFQCCRRTYFTKKKNK